MFVGYDREAVLQTLLQNWHETYQTRSPRLVTLVGEPGFGKTRIVHEFYSRVVANQDQPGYWPMRIHDGADDSGLSDSLRATRKLVRPEKFDPPAGSLPAFLWLGTVLSDGDGIHPDTGLDDIIHQVSLHLAYVIRRRERNQKAADVLRGVIGLIPLHAALELSVDLASLTAQIVDLFKQKSGGTHVTKHAGYEERLAAFYRTIRQIWGADGDNGPPVVIVIEDLHAAQEPTITLIRHILAASNLPFLFVACAQRQSLSVSGEVNDLVYGDRPGAIHILIDKLSNRDMITLTQHLLPQTALNTIERLAQRADGNPYNLKLLLLSLRARIKDGVLDVATVEISKLPSELDEILIRLWHQLTEAEQELLGVLSLAGHRVPIAVDIELRATLDQLRGVIPQDTGWVRTELDDRVFLEVARWHLARRFGIPRLSTASRDLAIERALASVTLLLARPATNGDTNDVLLACLSNLVQEAVDRDLGFDRRTVAEHLIGWSQTMLWGRRFDEAIELSRLAVRVLEHRTVRRSTAAVRLASMAHRQSCEATRLKPGHGAGHAKAIAEAENYLDWTLDIGEKDPTAVVLAHLQLARAYRTFGDGGEARRARAKAEYAKAFELFQQLEAPDADLRRDMLSATYVWTAADGHRREAAAQASEVARLAAEAHGEDHPLVHGALSDEAFYLRRVDRWLGAEAYTKLLDLRVRRWGDASHPVVASSMKNLAIALLELDDEDPIRQANDLLEKALRALMRSTGPEGSYTAVTMSALARARAYLTPYLSVEQVPKVLEAARGLAEEGLRLMLIVRPNSRAIYQRINLAEVRLAMGEESALDELAEILADRSRRYVEPRGVAETRWSARRLAAQLRRFNREAEADELIRRYALDESDEVWLD